MNNHHKLTEMLAILHKGIQPTVDAVMTRRFGEGWIQEMDRNGAYKRHAPDAALYLRAIVEKWNGLFSELSIDSRVRNWAGELKDVRNRLSHTHTDVDESDTKRTLETAELLLKAFGAAACAAQIGAMLVDQHTNKQDTKKTVNVQKVSASYPSLSELRKVLIDAAQAKILLTYGDVLAPYGLVANQGTTTKLRNLLTRLGENNKKRGEPLLSVLVVSKQTRRPGNGFYALLGYVDNHPDEQEELFNSECQKVYQFSWSDYVS